MEKALFNKLRNYILEFYESNPFVKMMDMQTVYIKEGDVCLKLEVKDEHTNFYHNAHGGVLMSMADTSMGAACLSCNKKVVTMACNMNFIKAIPSDSIMFATGRVIHNGLKTMVCETDVKDEEGELYGKATGTFFVIGAFDGK